jgi:hypothetical protein
VISRFDDLLQRVTLLNAQLEPEEHRIGSEVRKILHGKLWAIVGDLNSSLNLGLDNTALDLTAEGGRLRIHFWSGVEGTIAREVNIFIDRSFTVQKQGAAPTGPSTAAVTSRRDTQRQRALEDPSQGL